MINAIRKTGFLIEDPKLLGNVIGTLRSGGGVQKLWAEQLDAIRAQGYYQPLQQELIEQIEEVSL